MDISVNIIFMLMTAVVVGFKDASAVYTQKKGCRNHPADLVFVLDESGSIWGPHFKDQLDFVNNVIDAFDISPDKTHVGVETFANKARVLFHLGDMTSPEPLREAVNSIQQKRGETGTAQALGRMREDMFSPAHARGDVPHVAIVITDGESDDPVLTAIEAAEVHGAGITVFAIGVGVTNDDELHSIASSEDYVFTVENYGALDKLKDILAWEACKATTPKPTTPKPTTTTTQTTTTEATTTLPQHTQRCRPVDVIFSLPDEAGIKDTNTSLTFIQSLLPDVDIGADAVRVGLTPRLCAKKHPIPLNGHDTHSGYKNALKSRRLTSSRISQQVELLEIGHGDSEPERGDVVRNAAKIAILVVDNVAEDPDTTVDIAHYAKSQGIRLVTVGVGEYVDPQQLAEIASEEEDWYHVTNYDQLPSVHDELFDVICRPW